jgi:cell wall assembly regulator SMI1
MWIELAADASDEAQFVPPADEATIDRIEQQLGQPVPADLRALLLESDGILGEFDEEIVWTAERIAEDNASFRANASFADLYQSFDKLMFFGDNDGGDQFAFVPGEPEAGVLVWEHETDARRKVADDLADYLQRVLTADGDDWYADDEDED